MRAGDRSIADVFQDIVRNIQDIVRSEVRLAKTEAKQEIKKARSAAMLLSIGAISAVFALVFLLLALVYALCQIMPNWAAALVVCIVLGCCTAATAIIGLHRFKRVGALPKTLASLKENVAWARQQVK